MYEFSSKPHEYLTSLPPEAWCFSMQGVLIVLMLVMSVMFAFAIWHSRSTVPKVTVMDGREMGALVPESFDAILLDAPCSCEGNIRKE